MKDKQQAPPPEDERPLDVSDTRAEEVVDLGGGHFLYGADPECKHKIEHDPGGGVHCTKCRGWFCY